MSDVSPVRGDPATPGDSTAAACRSLAAPAALARALLLLYPNPP
jgi:hypothetical protein